MIWLDRLQDLQYYNQPKGLPCYCEIIVFPGDMILQGSFPSGGGSYTLSIEVLSPDGLTVFANSATSLPYFEYYFAQNPVTLDHFFNARLKSFVPAMCTNVCFILHVTVTRGGVTVFDKYTERYCQSTCCDLARDITVTQSDVGGPVKPSTNPTVPGTATPIPFVDFAGSYNTVKVTECGDKLITLRTKFDCYDKFLGNYYGTPPVVISGSASFQYENITNMRGRVVRRPREITREYSFNCRLQKAESTPVYRLEGFEWFPPWKMNEIEACLHSTEIYVDDRRFEYSGGTPFTQLTPCEEVFKLDATLQDCTIRQVFGCDTSCGQTANYDGAMVMFVIPDNYVGGAFYNEAGEEIAADYDGLKDYFRNLDGMYELNDIDVSGLGCLVYKAFSISGSGYLPGSFYYDGVTAGNRVFSAVLTSEDDICTNYGKTCAKPVIDEGGITIEDIVCDAPVLGTPVVEDITPAPVGFTGYGNWEGDADHTATLYLNQVTLNIDVTTETITEDPDNPGDPVYISGYIIGNVGVSGRPSTLVVLDHVNSVLPEGATIQVYPDGRVWYSGYTTSVTSSSVTIFITGLNYTI